MPNGVWSQISQYWVDGMMLMLSLIPAGASWPCRISQTCCCHGPLVLPQSMLISSPSAMPGLGQQLLGLLDVGLQRRQREVLGVDRRHVMMLAGRAAALVDQLGIGGRVAAELDRAPHALVVERLLGDLHAQGAGLRGLRLVDHRIRDRRRHRVGGDVELVDRVDLARGERRQLRRRGRAMVVVVDLVEVDRADHVGVVDVLAPVGLSGPLQDALLADRELGQGVRPGADRLLGEILAVLLEVRDAGSPSDSCRNSRAPRGWAWRSSA